MSRLRPVPAAGERPRRARGFFAVTTAALAAVLALAGAAEAQQRGPAAPAGNAERGAQVYENRCTGCHALDANRVGPAHRGVVGRRAGTASGFEYSDALRASRLVWSEALIQRWLANPEALIPGQQMGFRLGDAQERADVAAYLARESRR